MTNQKRGKVNSETPFLTLLIGHNYNRVSDFWKKFGHISGCSILLQDPNFQIKLGIGPQKILPVTLKSAIFFKAKTKFVSLFV